MLKYAPLKSDFVKAAAADSTVKHELSDDMFEVAADVPEFEAEIVETDSEVNISE